MSEPNTDGGQPHDTKSGRPDQHTRFLHHQEPTIQTNRGGSMIHLNALIEVDCDSTEEAKERVYDALIAVGIKITGWHDDSI